MSGLVPSLKEVAGLEFRYFFLYNRFGQICIGFRSKGTYVDAADIILQFLHVVLHGGVLLLNWDAFVHLDIDGGRILVLVHIRVNLLVMNRRWRYRPMLDHLQLVIRDETIPTATNGEHHLCDRS